MVSVAVGHCVASVVVSAVVFYRVIGHKVCRMLDLIRRTCFGEGGGGRECICWHCRPQWGVGMKPSW